MEILAFRLVDYETGQPIGNTTVDIRVANIRPARKLAPNVKETPKMKLEIGSWARLTHERVHETLRGCVGKVLRLGDSAFSLFVHGAGTCNGELALAEPWIPRVGERVRRSPLAPTLVVERLGLEQSSDGFPYVWCTSFDDQIPRWFRVAELVPLLDADGRPLRDRLLRPAVSVAPPAPSAPPPVAWTPPKCGRPGHDPECLCHRGWLREPEPEPTMIEARVRGERAWVAVGDGVEGPLAATMERAIEAWREARRAR